MSTPEAILFWVCAVVAVIGAIGVVAAPKAVYSAMFLAMTMIVLAVLYSIYSYIRSMMVQRESNKRLRDAYSDPRGQGR